MGRIDRKSKANAPVGGRRAATTFRLRMSVVLWGSLLLCGCSTWRTNDVLDRVVPTNDRPWVADMQRLSTAEIQAEEVVVKNIRNCQYVTANDYVVNYYDRRIRLADLRTVDFIVVPFQTKALAHTMLSFGLADGTYLCVSVEIRKELGEEYSPLLGVSNQFELYYLVADERDVIRLRTRYRDAEVYVYPTVATPENTRDLFLDVMRRANQLAMRPEFYHTLTNNCTTNIVEHVNKLQPQRVPFGWQVLLSGNSAKYAYDLGLLDNRLPFEELRELARVKDLANENFETPDFSRRIRARHDEIETELEAAQSERYDGAESGESEGELRDRLDAEFGPAAERTAPAAGRSRPGPFRAPQFRPGLSEGVDSEMSDRPGDAPRTRGKIGAAAERGARTAARTMLGPPQTPAQAVLQAAVPGSAQVRAARMGVGVATDVARAALQRAEARTGTESAPRLGSQRADDFSTDSVKVPASSGLSQRQVPGNRP